MEPMVLHTTILASVTAGILEAARALGLDVEAILAHAGIDPAVFADPDARIPVLQELRVWEVLSRHPVGLDIGERLGIASMGIVGYAMQHGATLGEALAWQRRHAALIHPEVMPHLERRDTAGRLRHDGSLLVFTRPPTAVFAALREPLFAQAAAMPAMLSAAVGSRLVPEFVSFPLPRGPDAARVEAYFACPVSWATPLFEIAFDAAHLDRPLVRADAALFGYLSRRAEELLAALPEQDSWSTRVQRAIGNELSHGEPKAVAIAKRFAVSVRTLHRRLGDEGVSFAALVERVRRERAELLLSEPRLSANEVAYLLGYSDPAAFSRAFKRWTGEAPSTWRARPRPSC